MFLAPGRIGSIGRTRSQGVGASLYSLFAAGEDGFLFYPMSDLTRLFTTSGGTVNVAADNDPVGLDLDSHSWGGKTLAQLIAAQPELWTNPVPSITNNAGTVGAYNQGTRTMTNSGSAVGQYPRFGFDLGLTAGKTYRVSGQLSGSIAKVNQVRLATAGVANNVGYNTGTGVLFGTVVAADNGVQFLLDNSGNWTGADSLTIQSLSVKEVPGNHAIQSVNTSRRPLWKSNSGKPYLAPDGSDDYLATPYVPNAASGLTIAAAFNSSVVSGTAMGGGDTTGNNRAVIALAGLGQLGIHWGTAITETIAVDRRNTDMIVVVSGDATSRDVWLWTAAGGLVNATSLFTAAVGSPDGTGGEMALCGRRNAAGGTPDNLLSGRLYAALARNKRSTESEISNIIVPNFRSAIQ